MKIVSVFPRRSIGKLKFNITCVAMVRVSRTMIWTWGTVCEAREGTGTVAAGLLLTNNYGCHQKSSSGLTGHI